MSEQCFSVKPGYAAIALEPCGDDVPLTAALTIRSAEEVRRETLIKARVMLDCKGMKEAADAVNALINTPRPMTPTEMLKAKGHKVLVSGQNNAIYTSPDPDPEQDTTPSAVAAAARVLIDAYEVQQAFCHYGAGLDEAMTALRALAAQTGGE